MMRQRIGISMAGLVVAFSAGAAFGQLIDAVQVASGLNRPVSMAAAPNDPDRLFIVEQPGIIKILDLNSGTVLPTPFLNIDSKVSNSYTGNGERGLFALAFHPNYFVDGDPNEGVFFVHYSANNGWTTIERYRVSNNPDVANPNSAELVLSEFQPFPNHNGGQIIFGPDGYLYVFLGDGGSGNDPGNRAQNLLIMLGKCLRLDVDGADDFPANANRNYAIPPDNPFVDDPQNPNALTEIWHYGLRNPWRASFDRLTGDLYIGDVGQNAREEIDFQPAGVGGLNYGWRCMEANRCTGLSGCTCFDDALTDPAWEYFQGANGFSVTGGFVYRGCEIPELFGLYVFADFISGRIWTIEVVDGDGSNLVRRDLDLNDAGSFVNQVASFGQDARGELYIADRGGAASGAIYKIVREAPAPAGDGTPPTVVHSGENANFSGYIDPRAESDNGEDVNVGLDAITIEFSEPVIADGCLNLDSANFSVQTTGGGELAVTSVDTSGNPVVTVHLNGLIPLQEWTTVTANVQDFEGNAIPSNGNQGPGALEDDRVDVAALPADVDQSGVVQPADLLRFRQIVTGVHVPPVGTPEDFADMDRSGGISPIDLLRFRQLVNGTGNATRNWSQAPNNTLMNTQP